jgi:hypothetical protein
MRLDKIGEGDPLASEDDGRQQVEAARAVVVIKHYVFCGRMPSRKRPPKI